MRRLGVWIWICHCTNISYSLAESGAAVCKALGECRVFLRPVTGGHPQQQTTARKHINRCGGLGDMRRVAQGEDDACHAEGDVLRRYG